MIFRLTSVRKETPPPPDNDTWRKVRQCMIEKIKSRCLACKEDYKCPFYNNNDKRCKYIVEKYEKVEKEMERAKLKKHPKAVQLELF